MKVKIRSRSPKVIKCKFSKSLFLSFYAQKKHLGITGGQNQVKVTKGHQVQIFKKIIFGLLCIEKALDSLDKLDQQGGLGWKGNLDR